jgi:RimJ/RimL family protein N-acetyltransferase
MPPRPRARAAAEQAKFGHGSEVVAPDGRILLGTYHSSRYNQNTRRLTPDMFEACSPARSSFAMVEAITTERLVLRRARLEDAEPMHRIMSDPVAMRYWSTLPHERRRKAPASAVAEEAEGGAVRRACREVELGDQHAGLLAPNSASMSPRSSQMKLWP